MKWTNQREPPTLNHQKSKSRSSISPLHHAYMEYIIIYIYMMRERDQRSEINGRHNTTPNRQISEKSRRRHFLRSNPIFYASSHGLPAIYYLPPPCDSSPSDPCRSLLLPPWRQSSGLSEGQFPPSLPPSLPLFFFFFFLCFRFAGSV